jgi:endonuclease-3
MPRPREGARGRRKGREGKAARAERAERVFDLLAGEHPDAACALAHEDAYQLAVATILSAQCTDARVNLVTPALFARYPDVRSLARAEQRDLEERIRSTGFFRNKAKNLIGMAKAVVERHGGEIPRTMADLSALPGIGRKTANVILGNAFGVDEGVVVDTHVRRLANRLGFTRHSDPVKIERDLMALFPRDRWTLLPHLLIFHGRAVCVARRPKCEACVLAPDCPSSRV